MFKLVISNKNAIDEIIATSSRNASENVLLKTQVENLEKDKSRLIAAGKSLTADVDKLQIKLNFANKQIEKYKPKQDQRGRFVKKFFSVEN